jgi:hypothetical protein
MSLIQNHIKTTSLNKESPTPWKVGKGKFDPYQFHYTPPSWLHFIPLIGILNIPFS